MDKLKSAHSCEEQLESINHVNNIRNHLQTMGTLAQIRHSINTKDKYYDNERSYWDKYSPYMMNWILPFIKNWFNQGFERTGKNLADNFYSS